MVGSLKDFDQTFQTCLQLVESGAESVDSVVQQYPEMADELRPRLEAALWMSSGKSVFDPRPGFVTTSRRHLVAQIQKEGAAQPIWTAWMLSLKQAWAQFTAQLSYSQRKYALQAAVILLLMISIVVGSTGVGLAAQNAMPGEPLYPVKLAMERVELMTTFDLAGDIRLHVTFAQNRLREVQQLLLDGQYALIPGTLARFETHVTQAVQKLEVLASRDAENAREVAMMVHGVLLDQAVVLRGLSSLIPKNLEPQLASALGVTASGAAVVRDVVERSGGSLNQYSSPADNPTSTLVGAQGSTATLGIQDLFTPTPSATLYWSPTATTSLTDTSTPTLEPTSTRTAQPPTSTPKPPGDGDDTSPTNTPKPPPTSTDKPEPTKTKKPLPDPTRRPPKPTENSKDK